MEIEVILTPAEIALLPERDLSGTVCVVFDVLRATSTILAALANGARRVCPALTPGEARALRKDHFPGALLGGERGGQRIEGFDLGNSPLEYTPETVFGRDIVTTTTNGTVALRACAGAREIHAGALLNLKALAAHLRESAPERVLLVCAGSGESFSLEDAVAAGELLARCMANEGITTNDAGQAVLAIFQRCGGDALALLRSSSNGRRLAEIGLGKDIDWCARMDSVGILAVGTVLPSGITVFEARLEGPEHEWSA